MPFLIDGNNLMPAQGEIGPEIGRQGLCERLERLAERGERICVVFDGPPPPEPTLRGLAELHVEAIFASPRTADEIILERISADSAPRRLVVVSTDREIRQAARRRRCPARTSQEFARMLADLHNSVPRGPD